MLFLLKKSLFNLSTLYFRLPALHQKFDLPAPFVLHTDCPHYWRYHLPGYYLDGQVFSKILDIYFTV